MSTDRGRLDAASSPVRQGQRTDPASSMSVLALKEPPVTISTTPTRTAVRCRRQASVSRQRPCAEHRGEVSAALALRDLPLRISVALAGLLLTVGVPLPGFVPTGAYAAFHDTSARYQLVWPWDEFTVAGGLA